MQYAYLAIFVSFIFAVIFQAAIVIASSSHRALP